MQLINILEAQKYLVPSKLKFTMSVTKTKITRHTKIQENMVYNEED